MVLAFSFESSAAWIAGSQSNKQRDGHVELASIVSLASSSGARFTGAACDPTGRGLMPRSTKLLRESLSTVPMLSLSVEQSM